MIQMLVINDDTFEPGPQTSEGIEFNVTVSESSLHAFNQIIHINPDAIVLNVEKPGVDGKQIFRRIRNMQVSRNVPILLLVELDNELEVRPLCFDNKTEYYTLPITRSEVFAWVAKALNASGSGSQKLVMVVDDDPVVLDMVKLYLGAKYRVSAVSSAAEAKAKLSVQKPDIILLDIAMPDVDGKDLYKQIRAIEGCDSIPILFQTGMAGVNTVRECVKLGASGFVIKPIQKAVLLERIEECLNPVQHDKRRKKVYIYEEFDFMYSLVQGYLKEYYDLVHEESVIQSINHLEEISPDYIMLDYDNSAFMLARVHEKATELHIPLIVYSKDLNSDTMQRERNKRNTYILPLPLSAESLLEALNDIGEWQEN